MGKSSSVIDVPEGYEPIVDDAPEGYEPVEQPPVLEAAKPLSFIEKMAQKFAPSPETQIARAQNIYNISQKSGRSMGDIQKNYEREVLRYLKPPESYAPADKMRMALDQGFAKGLIGTNPVYPEFQSEHPVLDAIGEGSGGLAGLVATGKALESVGVGYKTIFDKYGIKGIPLAATLAKMTVTGATFGAKTAAEKLIQLQNHERITLQSAKDVLDDTAFGLGLGAVESISKPLVRVPSAMVYGYTTAKIQGASDMNAMVNAAVFGIFALLNRTDYSKEYKLAAINKITDTMTKKATKFGLPPDVAKQQAERFVNENLLRTTGEADPVKGWEKVFTSKQYNLLYFDNLNENLKTLRYVSQIPPGAPPVAAEAPLIPGGFSPSGERKVSIPAQFNDPAAPELLDYLSRYVPPKMVASMSGEERLALANAPAAVLRDFVINKVIPLESAKAPENVAETTPEEAGAEVPAKTEEEAVSQEKPIVEAPTGQIDAPEGYEPIAEKEPWQMTKEEWDTAREDIKPNIAQSNYTKKSGSEASGKIKKLNNLLYGVNDSIREELTKAQEGKIKLSRERLEEIEDRLNTPISHYDVIKKALSEGKSISSEVLKDYFELQKPKKAASVYVNPEYSSEDAALLDKIHEEVSQGTPGRRYVTRDAEGEVVKAGYEPSDYPEYFKNKGYTKKNVLVIIDKVKSGKQITEKQKVIVDDLVKSAKEQYDEENRLIAEGVTQSEIDEANRIGEAQAFSEVEAGKNNGIKSFPSYQEADSYITDIESKGGNATITRVNQDGSVDVHYITSKEFESQGLAYPNEFDIIPSMPKKNGAGDIPTGKNSEQPEGGKESAHRPPNPENGSRLDDLSLSFSDDIYEKNALEYFGEGNTYDRKSIDIIQKSKGNPDAVIKVYRAVDKGVKDFNPGDWVTINKAYAIEHGENILNGQYDIIEKEVRAKDIIGNGDSIHEFGYYPQESNKSLPAKSAGSTFKSEALTYPETESLSSAVWQTKMPKEPQTKKTINKTEIITWTEKAFNVPFKGKATHRFKNLAGIYQRKQEIIRLRKWGELEPLTHELAHHIDKKMRQALGAHWKRDQIPVAQRQAAIKELLALDYDQTKRRSAEGFAEFMRHYLTTGEAQTKAPTFYDFFTKTFLPANKDLQINLDKLKDMLKIWQDQGAENRIIEQIDFRGEHTNIAGIKDKIRKARDWWMKNFNDEFYLIQKIEDQMGIKSRENIKPSQDPFEMATYAKSKASAIARTFVMEKAIDETGNVVGKSLKEILDPVKPQDMKTFIAYGTSKRALLLAGRSIESGIDIDDAKFIVDKYKDKGWDKIIDEMTEWSNHLLDWVVRAGGLGPEEVKVIRELNPIYLPFKRAFVDEVGVVKGVGKSFVNKGGAVKKIKGSGRPITNPIESLIGQATEMILKAQKINIARLIANLAEKEGVGGFITKVPAPMEATSFTLEQIQRSLDILGIDTEGADLGEVLTVFTQGWQYRGKDNIVSFWKNGKREFYELHPDLYRALMGLDMLERGPLLKILSPFARLLRLGATGIKVSFGLIRNPFRDALSYAVLSKNKKAIPLVDTAKGVVKELTAKPGDVAWRFKAAGGSLSGMMGYDRAATMAVYDEIANAKLKAYGKVIKAVEPKNWFKTLAFLVDKSREGLNVTELGPRIAELESSYNRYQKEHPDWSEEDAFIASFNDAQDVTINFTKSGYMAKRLNEVIAFFNASLRGPEKTYRAARENPIGFIIKGLAWLTVPILVNWFNNKDKQWYKNIPPEYRYSNVFIEVNEQTIVRLPIPFDVGVIFMGAPVAALDYLDKKDPKSLKAIGEILKRQVPLNWPSAMAPIMDIATNKDTFGTPIETKGMEYRPRQERKNYYTSQVAVSLSKALESLGMDVLSPVQIDHLMKQYTGGFTRQFPQGSILQSADIPILSDVLVRSPERPSYQMKQFFNDWEVLSQKYVSKSLEKGEMAKYQRLKLTHKTLETYLKDFTKYQEKKNIEGIRYTHEKIERLLSKAGY